MIQKERKIPGSRDRGPRDWFPPLLFCICLLFYLFFAFYDGVVIAVDSPTYIGMDLAREPLYPLFLLLLRTLFGEGPLYLQLAVVFQSLLAGFAAYSLARFFQKTFRLGRAVTSLMAFIPLAVSLLCRFAAGRASMFTNSILTEGICLSLWLLFFRCLLAYCFAEDKKKAGKQLALACLLAVLLISSRKQMLACLPVLLLAVFGKTAARSLRKNWKAGLLRAVLCVFLILLSTGLLDRCYNFALRGEFVRHSSDNRFLATMVFYTAQREDAAYIDDARVQELFLSIYGTCQQGGFLSHSAGEGWLARVTHFGDHYDHIQIDTLWPMARAYANTLTSDPVAQEFETDALMDAMTGALLPHTWSRLLPVLADNLLSGLVTTVAQRTPILLWYTAAAYLSFLGLALFLWLRSNDRRAPVCALLTLAGILINVTVVSAVIFCQTRYTIYNMPLFYMTGLLMLTQARPLLRRPDRPERNNTR